VVEPEQAAPRHRLRPGALVQLDEHAAVGRSEPRDPLPAVRLRSDPELLPEDILQINRERGEPTERAVVDYIAGMTDRYAIKVFNDLYVPRTWSA